MQTSSVRATSPSGRASPSPKAPSHSSPGFTFAVKGDWAAGTEAQAAITREMCTVRMTRPFDDVVTTGDNFYNPDGTATPVNFQTPEACLLARPGHRWHAAWGNHDVIGRSTRDVLGAEKYYEWSKSGMDFFFLDSNRPNDEQQLKWLEAHLAASTAAIKIAVFHHPPFTVGGHESNLAVRQAWVPLFERYKVALVLNGHNHDYEHSRINNIDYVVSGGGGADIYPCFRQEAWLLKCEAVHHFLLVTRLQASLNVAAFDQSGKTIDTFSILK